MINAGGMYAREIGALAGVTVPIIPMAHEYLVLEPSGLPLDMPTMRDPSLLVYFRPESGGLIMGGYERNCAPWSLDGIPADFNGKLLEEDWPRFEELMENAIVRVPTLEGMGVVKLINGPEAFTPDGEFILGPSDVRGFWVAAGFCAHGLAGAGGMGQLVAEWVVEGTPSLDVWHMDSRRFGAAYRSREYTLARTAEIYETYYDVKYPGHERSAGRPLRVSPAYERLVAARRRVRREVGLGARELVRAERRRPETSRCGPAAGRASSGRPRSAPSTAPAARRSRSSTSRRSRRSTSAAPGAAAFLESLCANRVARDVGAVTYTQMLNARGGIECDFTVTRLAEERFRIVTGTAFGQHDLAWIRAARAARRVGARRRRDLGARVLRRLGAERAGAAAAADDDRPLERRVRLHARAGALDRRRPVPRGQGHVRRRARLGAVLPGRVRRAPLGHDLGGGAAARARRRRVQGDRLAPAREGLPGLGRRHHARGLAVRSRSRLRGQARQGRRSSAATRSSRGPSPSRCSAA